VTSEVQAVMTQTPEMEDLVPSEASPQMAAGDPVSSSTFPKVLRHRLDKFFADGKISPKAERMMWVKIVTGLTVLAGSWIALYALRPGSWTFVALYLLGGLAQTFLLLNIAHDSNHNAISRSASVNKTLNYVFDVCGINSYMWRILHHRGHHSCINVHGEDDALTGRGLLRFTPHEPHRPLQRFQHIYALVLYALFSLDYVFVRDFECFFFPTHDYLSRTKHPAREYVILFASKAFYFTYMLILPDVVLGKSPWLVAGASRQRTLLIARTFPRAATSLTMAFITSSRPRPIMRRRTRSWVGSRADSTITSCIICARLCATPTMLL